MFNGLKAFVSKWQARREKIVTVIIVASGIIEADWREKKEQEHKEQVQELAYIALNNLYLDVQRGRKAMSVRVSNTLRTLVGQAYDQGDPMIDWWGEEFRKLPRWNDF